MTEQNPWRPTRRRFTDILLAALAPVAACSVALGGLTTWVGAGNAGTPARIDVDPGRVYLPDGDSRYTAAFFVIANSGNAEDRLTAVTSSAVLGEITVPRHSSIGSGAACRTGELGDRPRRERTVHVAVRPEPHPEAEVWVASRRHRAVHAALRTQRADRDRRRGGPSEPAR